MIGFIKVDGVIKNGGMSSLVAVDIDVNVKNNIKRIASTNITRLRIKSPPHDCQYYNTHLWKKHPE